MAFLIVTRWRLSVRYVLCRRGIRAVGIRRLGRMVRVGVIVCVCGVALSMIRTAMMLRNRFVMFKRAASQAFWTAYYRQTDKLHA